MEEIEQYNKAAGEHYREKYLEACPVCGRKFFEESLQKHLKYCQ
jgi:DNA repair exonuclease SbcCD ATPase subunit